MTQVAPDSGRRARRDLQSDHLQGAPTGYHDQGQPAAAWGAQPEAAVHDPARGRHASGFGQNFAGVVGWTLLGSLVPGTGLIAAGRRGLGGVVLVITALFASAALTYAVIGDPKTLGLSLIGKPDMLLYLAIAMVALVLAWAAIVIATHFALRRHSTLSTIQRVLCAALVTSLIGLVAVPTARAGSYALITRDTINAVFNTSDNTQATGVRPKSTKADPWADVARVNVLLLGSDAGADRTGIRPDTIILASIDTHTGDAVLFSLPRNMQRVPFPPGSKMEKQYPYGFQCTNAQGVNSECLLNALWSFGEQHWKEYYPNEVDKFHAGLRATEDAVYQLTGLQIDQFAMLNLRGFMQFVDALGGLTLNVKDKIPVGGHGNIGDRDYKAPTSWITPGNHKLLNGYESLWFARARQFTSDFARMQRQRCVIGAVVGQSDPAKMALAFPDIARAAKDNIITDIPLHDLPAWVDLSMRVKKAHVRSLPFTDAVINTVHPDINKIRSLVKDALTPPPTTSPSVAPSASPSKKPGTGTGTGTGTNAAQAQDVTQVC